VVYPDISFAECSRSGNRQRDEVIQCETSVCPATGCTITENFFQRPNAAQSNPDTQWTYRIDYKPRDKDSFSARYIHDRSSFSPDFLNNANALAGFDTQQGGPSELAEGTWTHIFTPNLLNEFRVSEVRLSFLFAPTAQTIANPLYAQETLTFGDGTLPALGPNQNFPQGRGEDLYQFQDTVGWTKGRQSFRIGGDIGRQIETAVELLRKLHDRNSAVGSDNDELPALEGDVRGSGFEHIAGELLAFFNDFGGAFDDRGAAVHDRF